MKSVTKNKVCVYAISKNEEKFVDKWYESMKEADYVCVLDTGSTDNTANRLKELGAIVETKIIDPWRFDIARNESLKLVPDDSTVLICTDLDEWLEPGWAEPLREKWIPGYHLRGYYKYSWSHLENGESGRIFKYDKIHSNHEWRWIYPVHEALDLITNDKEHATEYDRERTIDLWDDIHLHHYPDKNKSRGQYLSLLEQRKEEYPEDWRGLIYLAHEYFYQKQYNNSIELLNYLLANYKDRYTNLEQASCHLYIADAYSCLNDADNAIKNYLLAIDLDKTYREPYLNLAKVLLTNKAFITAEFYLKNALVNTYRHYTWLERDISWNYELYDLLCLASYYSGNKKDAIAYASKALSFMPDNKRLQNNLKLCLDSTSDKELV
jgi:tetratricopeptide (TPR) repeat protein